MFENIWFGNEHSSEQMMMLYLRCISLKSQNKRGGKYGKKENWKRTKKEKERMTEKEKRLEKKKYW